MFAIIFYRVAVPVAIGMQKSSHQHFGLCILAFNAAHIIASSGGIVHICHGIKIAVTNSIFPVACLTLLA